MCDGDGACGLCLACCVAHCWVVSLCVCLLLFKVCLALADRIARARTLTTRRHADVMPRDVGEARPAATFFSLSSLLLYIINNFLMTMLNGFLFAYALTVVPSSLAFLVDYGSSKGRANSIPRLSLEGTAINEVESMERGHVVNISYEGREVDVLVEPEETILSAIERSHVADRLAIHSVPFDCRRGNCLTCTATHAHDSEESSLKRGMDGLSPNMSEEVKNRGYVLTCSSRVVGDGLKLTLGQNNDVWQELHCSRFREEASQLTRREASARAMRLAAEQNVPKWTRTTERVLESSPEQ